MWLVGRQASMPVRTVWPSGLRRWLKAPVREGVGSNPTGVIHPFVWIDTATMCLYWMGNENRQAGIAFSKPCHQPDLWKLNFTCGQLIRQCPVEQCPPLMLTDAKNTRRKNGDIKIIETNGMRKREACKRNRASVNKNKKKQDGCGYMSVCVGAERCK